ncbi:hypothetical protein ACW5XW_08240 [Aeromonas piscicola]
MTHRYYEQDFSPWWFLLAPIAWVILLTLAFGPVLFGGHYEPKVRHPVRVPMDIPICYQVDGLPDGYCDQVIAGRK